MSFNILVVDDSKTTRTIIGKILQMAQVPVRDLHEASNGKEALKILENKWIDLIFTDINMPVMNGIEMIDNMKKNDLISDIPVVVISTEGSQKRINDLQDKGIKAYIRKPFTPEQICSIITNILGDWNGRQKERTIN